jgi:hypothetical protein
VVTKATGLANKYNEFAAGRRVWAGEKEDANIQRYVTGRSTGRQPDRLPKEKKIHKDGGHQQRDFKTGVWR